MKRLLVLSIGATATIGLANLPVWTASAAEQRERIAFEQLEWTSERLSMTADAATRDSDGDGWSDWYERMEGTDPRDAASHPGSITLEVVDRTVFVQSIAFPDRMVVVDLALPEGVDSVGELLTALDGLGNTTVGRLHDEMDAAAEALGGTDVQAILKEFSAQLGTDELSFGTRVGGVDASLLSAVHTTINAMGEKEVEITSKTGFVVLTFHDDGTTTAYEVDRRGYDPESGNGVVLTRTSKGTKLLSSEWVSYENGKPVSTTSWDPKHGLTKTGPPTTQPTDTTQKPTDTTAKPTDTTQKPTETTAKPTDTTTGGYRDPDADIFVMPTATEIAERVEFLRTVNARFGPRADVVTDLPKNRPGVADPAEPPCEDERCVVFVDLGAPDMNRTSGGCPPTYCTSAGPRQLP